MTKRKLEVINDKHLTDLLSNQNRSSDTKILNRLLELEMKLEKELKVILKICAIFKKFEQHYAIIKYQDNFQKHIQDMIYR